MPNFVVKKNRSVLQQKLITAFSGTYRSYERKLDISFTESRKWPSRFEQTYRRNQSVIPAGRIRDTYDLGFLQRGRRRVFTGGVGAGTSYKGIPYSWKVFYGFVASGTPVPARPLPKLVAAELDWVLEFKKNWDKS
jgi:hypothetical protein